MYRIILQCIFLVISLTVLSAPTLYANSYSIPDINVDVTVTENGTLMITEERTYQFDGDFSWADYRISKEGFSEIRNIRVSEGDSTYINLNNEEVGTFSVSESDDAVVIKWNYSASDTTRTFTISYELTGAIAIGPEWSSLFRNYLASGREKSTSSFNLNVRLPQPVSSDSLYTWQRDKAMDFQINKQEQSVEFTGSDISRQEAAIVRVLFSTAVFDENQVQVTNPDLTLVGINELEAEYQHQKQEQAERDAYYAEITPTATIFLSLTGILVFILLYKKYGTRHSTGQISSRETLVIPGQQPPALIGKLLLSRQTTSNHLVATIFDLARRGWLKIQEEEKEEDSGWFSEDKSGFKVSLPDSPPDDPISEYEKMTMDFIRSQVGSGTDTFEEIFNSKDSSAAKWYSKWTTEVKKAFEEQKWIDKESYRGVIANSIIQFLLLGLSIALLILGSPIALIAAFITFALLIASFAITRRTPIGEETYKRWKNYQDGLKNADERTIRMEMLDRHFIFATALHLSKKQIETILEAPQGSSAEILIPWIILTHGSATNPASIASSFSTLAATGSTSFAGTTGAGTGASVTSAGGGVSGGAG